MREIDAGQNSEARRTQESFGYEWTYFHDWQPSGRTNFDDYFSHLNLQTLSSALVLDAGCGMGRHTKQIAPLVDGVIAMDFSRAIDAAARNVADEPNVLCVQADLASLPFNEATFDFVYSIGVLHHLHDTEGTLQGLVRALKPGGRLRVYLYWKRSGAVGALLKLVALIRRVTTRLPFPVLRMLCFWISVVVLCVVLTPYRVLAALGVKVKESWPMAVYVKYPFRVLYNDQFDRFSAPIEKRYAQDDVRHLLERLGLGSVEVHPRYGWIGDGVKQGTPVSYRSHD